MQSLTRNILSLVIGLILTLNLSSPTVYSMSKTPDLKSNLDFSEIEPVEMPADYPTELLEFYNKNIDSRSYIVVDQETEKILAQGAATTPYPIASMTKVISTYLILDAIDQGQLKMDDKITIPKEIVEGISHNPELSNVGLEEEVEYPVKDLIYAVMIESANDATSALMWKLYGSEQEGVEAMIDKLAEWNITDVALYSTSGAPNLDVPESFWMPGSNDTHQNTMSAADLALATKHIIEEKPFILDIAQTKDYIFMEGTDQERPLYNMNQLLEGGTYARQGVTGLKSGFTNSAGKCFVATGSQNGRDYIAIAMGVFEEAYSSYWEIEILLDGLLDYPDLYQKDLPTITKESLTLEETTFEDVAESEIEEQTLTNHRDNPITNFMRGIFNFFKK